MSKFRFAWVIEKKINGDILTHNILAQKFISRVLESFKGKILLISKSLSVHKAFHEHRSNLSAQQRQRKIMGF